MNQAIIDKKAAAVEAVSDRIKNSASAVVVEYRGLSVAEVTELRRSLRKENVEMSVLKNGIVSRAAEKLGYNELTDSLKGPNAFVFSDDAVAPSRILAKFAKKHENLVLKSGIVEGKVVGADTLSQLAKLPNKEGMISMFLGCLQSPVIKFACAVKAVADSKTE